MIEVEHVGKTFGKLTAVEDVTFRAEDGCITGLLGPNGAGKTTTLRMVCASIRPDRGSAKVDGYNAWCDGQMVRTKIGVLPDARGLYPRLTAREHVRYFGRLHGLGGSELERRIDRLLERFDMQRLADRRTEGFSAGERLKVALARALVHQPQNILLDEPTTGLDVMTTRNLREAIRSLRTEGRCVLLSTHVMQEVAALCDQIVVMAEGRTVAHGDPESLLRATGKSSLEDAFVAAIGTDAGVSA
ncbi:MAG TPA: ATP-binding cassette domain-containing protein [Polyangiaceae bacterium]|nr:ATP-binding cassette domain-containing protein [Polyangiaceae bacterium]